MLRTFKNSPICTILPLTTKRLKDNYVFHVDLEEIDSTVLVEQIKTVSKIRIVKPYRKNGKMVAIFEKSWSKINKQLEIMYRLKPMKCEYK